LVDRIRFVLNILKCFGILELSFRMVEVLEGSMEGKHLVITWTLTINNQEIPTHPLIDCGATGIAFKDHEFACYHQIPLPQVKQN
jgi:hypothetical protein